MHSLSLDIKGDKSSLPVSISDGPAALKIGVADPNTDYPFLTKKVGSIIKRDQNWTAMAFEKLGLKGDPTYSLSIKGGKGQIVMRRYNERAVEKLKAHLEAVPDFDPYHDQ